MKEIGNSNWSPPNTNATNTSLFTGLPGGGRLIYGYYYYIYNSSNWWSSTESISNNAWYRGLSNHVGILYRNFQNQGNGYSIRCVKD